MRSVLLMSVWFGPRSMICVGSQWFHLFCLKAQKRHDLGMTFVNRRLHGEVTCFRVEA